MKREINNLGQIESNRINTNKVNDIFYNELKFDSSNSLANNHVQYPLPMVTKRLRGVKISRQTSNSGLTCLLDSGYTYSMIKCRHFNAYKYTLRANKVGFYTV